MKRVILVSVLSFVFLSLATFDAQERWDTSNKDKNDLKSSVFSSTEKFWARSIGGSNFESGLAQQTSDNGYIICGIEYFGGFLSGDIWIIKLNVEGEIEWQKSYGGTGDERSANLKQTVDGGYIVAGLTESFSDPSGDIWVFKLTPTGEIEWQNTYGGSYWDRPSSVQQTSDGGYIASGMTRSFPVGRIKAWILKLSTTGDVEWQRMFEDQTDGNSILQTNDGGYIVAGELWPMYGRPDAWIVKLSSAGSIEWQRRYGGDLHERANSIQQTVDGGYIVAGYNWIPTQITTLGDIWIFKLSSDGDIEWQRSYGGDKRERASSVCQTIDGGYIVAGSTESFGAGKTDALVIKLSSFGVVEWQKTYGGVDYDGVGLVQQLEDGGYLASGTFTHYLCDEKTDVLFMKLFSAGNIGPSCDFISNAGLAISDTYVTPVDTGLISEETNVSPIPTNIIPQNTNIEPILICSNLNQPPVDVVFKREVNRSLYLKEILFVINWNPNPLNSDFTIAEYRVYRKSASECDKNYELIGIAPGTVLNYMDRHLKADDNFIYLVSSVNSDGHESTKFWRGIQ